MTAHLGVDPRIDALRTKHRVADGDEVTGGADVDDGLRAVAKQLAAQHVELAVPAAPPHTAGAAHWRSRLRGLSAAVERLHPGAANPTTLADLREVSWLGDQYTHHRNELFRSRFSEGAIREDAPGRAVDVLVEAARLATDVELLFGPRAARRFLGWYHEFSNEHHPRSLADFYIANHCLEHCRSTEASPDDVAALVAMARQHLGQAKPRLVLIGGGPGTGKSTLAEAIAEVVGWPVLSSREVRSEIMAAVADDADPGDPWRADRTDAVYARLLERAAQLLHQGEAVVIDASWADEDKRVAARTTAQTAGASLVEIECSLDRAIARERLAWQQASPWDTRVDDPVLVDALATERDPWEGAVTIDTALPLLRCRSDALKAILGFPVRTAA